MILTTVINSSQIFDLNPMHMNWCDIGSTLVNTVLKSDRQSFGGIRRLQGSKGWGTTSIPYTCPFQDEGIYSLERGIAYATNPTQTSTDLPDCCVCSQQTLTGDNSSHNLNIRYSYFYPNWYYNQTSLVPMHFNVRCFLKVSGYELKSAGPCLLLTKQTSEDRLR